MQPHFSIERLKFEAQVTWVHCIVRWRWCCDANGAVWQRNSVGKCQWLLLSTSIAHNRKRWRNCNTCVRSDISSSMSFLMHATVLLSVSSSCTFEGLISASYLSTKEVAHCSKDACDVYVWCGLFMVCGMWFFLEVKMCTPFFFFFLNGYAHWDRKTV